MSNHMTDRRGWHHPSWEQHDALLRRIEKLEQKVAELDHRTFGSIKLGGRRI